MKLGPKEFVALEDDPYWYKDAVVYEAHVRAFRDSDGDGTGDFRGLAEKLDYLQDLGITAIWLTPFCPSPLRDDGYDISSYTDINPAYGNLRDFKEFLGGAHERGIRVITELVLNHTSDQHIWFQRARRAAPNSRWRNFYVWSDTRERYEEARIIFRDFEPSNWSWDHLAKAYYWHRFYSHQPDLNYDNPDVQRAMLRVIDSWLSLGVDGLRLDAVPYLYERDGTNCENLPETYEFLKKLRAHVDKRFKNRMFLGEANQWPEDAVAYFGEGDQCHMAFHFPLMTRMFMALRMEDRFPIIDILDQTPAIPDSCQWALFLRNHDELTLEMVTDEARDYMYRVYAQDPRMRVNLGIRRRLAPLLENNRRRIEMMNGLLLSLPGTPVIYYGDEIGMGDNYYLGDRNGVRTPMQWSADRNAGFSSANPQKLYLPVIIDPEYHYESLNVEAQQNNPSSLLWWMKRLISLRRRFQAFGRGSIQFLNPANPKILAYIREYQEERILIVANLSRFVQYVELDLSAYQGVVPIELFGRTEFPAVSELPYLLTLGPHSFYWFLLESKRETKESMEVASHVLELPLLTVAKDWESVFRGKAKEELEAHLPGYLKSCRWFGGKAQKVSLTEIIEAIPIPDKQLLAHLTIVRVDYLDRDSEEYVLPLNYVAGEQADALMKEHPLSTVARVQVKSKNETGILYDALVDKQFSFELFHVIASHHRRKGRRGELFATTTRFFRRPRKTEPPLEPFIPNVEQSNTSIIYGDRYILKLFRRPDRGINPDLEIGLFLNERNVSIAPVAGAIEYRVKGAEPTTVAILMNFIPNEGDAWRYTLEHLGHYYENALARTTREAEPAVPAMHPLELVGKEPSDLAQEMIGPYMEAARLIGRRTAELHVALASNRENPDFAPEPFSKLYQRSLYQSMRNLTLKSFGLLNQFMKILPEGIRLEAQQISAQEKEILSRFRSLVDRKVTAMRIRCHGDYHLGQLLFTGKDFVIIDFEGEPARPISERRIKRSPLRDVAGMLRSFHYAAYSAIFSQEERGLIRPEDLPYVERWALFWYTWIAALFLQSYLEPAGQSAFLPKEREELRVLLDLYLLEKAIYELGYELNHRPNWVRIPIRGIQKLMES
ncbi:MAG: maltose alpha-D-glucosyltransferase [Candidatus Abyssobacteria bacterium SURF_5]|uniref:Maltokinase n=1 Tax=Abyssobacteria bacterium (strain SURF_5) TaxID=2093360 RepID=A0A3A4NHX7_ABYX5|nr:MAG: maltose alpha-D-glucosyltransferase [Candidatus Abyssubacteria bacterium SURF_5]